MKRKQNKVVSIEIHDGLGDLNIRGAKDCTIFEYKNRSKFLVWEMNWNTLMNFFVGQIAKRPILYLNYFYDLQSNVEQGTVDEFNLEKLFKPFLRSFTNAKYELELLEIYDAYHIIKTGVSTDYYPKTREHKISKAIWGGGHPLVYAIQESINEKTVDDYKTQIRAGIKLQIIFLKAAASEVRLILDGHHKLEAYNQTGVNPSCIQITKMTNYKVKENIILQSFEKHKTANTDELRIKLESHLKNTNTL